MGQSSIFMTTDKWVGPSQPRTLNDSLTSTFWPNSQAACLHTIGGPWSAVQNAFTAQVFSPQRKKSQNGKRNKTAEYSTQFETTVTNQ